MTYVLVSVVSVKSVRVPNTNHSMCRFPRIAQRASENCSECFRETISMLQRIVRNASEKRRASENCPGCFRETLRVLQRIAWSASEKRSGCFRLHEVLQRTLRVLQWNARCATSDGNTRSDHDQVTAATNGCARRLGSSAHRNFMTVGRHTRRISWTVVDSQMRKQDCWKWFYWSIVQLCSIINIQQFHNVLS